MIQNSSAIILAAGKGTRMKSSMPKVMHKVAGRTMIDHVIHACTDMDITIVISPDMPELAKAVSPHKTVIQHKQLGTGDAVKAAHTELGHYDGAIFILYGDCPFIETQTLEALLEAAQKTGLSILGFETDNPKGYGRLVIMDDVVSEIVEDKDCTPDQKALTTCNAGVYCVTGGRLFCWLDKLSNDNAQGEYYLTDMVSIAKTENIDCAYVLTDETQVLGVNSRSQLAQAEFVMQEKLRKQAMDNGVTMIDPQSVYLSIDTKFSQDVIIEPNVVIGSNVCVGKGTHIHAFSHIEGAEIGANAQIGPFARIRPKSKIGDNVTVGNFIEVNRSEFKTGSKSKHLSYIGDAIIGEKTNIGAGTVIANYDGFNKHQTTIGNNVFVGSNSTLVSPMTIGDGAMIGAGSTVTKNIAADALAVARVKEFTREGWALSYRTKHKKD